MREEDLEPAKAFPDGFEAKWTADKETHCLCFKEVEGSGQVEAELVELLPEEVAELDKAREAMVELEADESEEEGGNLRGRGRIQILELGLLVLRSNVARLNLSIGIECPAQLDVARGSMS